MFAECVQNLTGSYGLVASLFLGGLVGSLTHCVGMCSPFVLAQTESGPILQKPFLSLLLPYHFGRMTTYVVMGGIMYGFVNLAYLFSDEKVLITAPLLMLAGVLFLISAFPSLSALFPWAGRLKLPFNFSFISKKISPLFKQSGIAPRYFLGVLLGFMPCGLVVAALMAASTAPSLIQSMVAMAAFSVGTMPALMAIGLGGKSLKQRLPGFSKRFTQAAMVISSIWLFALAGMLVL